MPTGHSSERGFFCGRAAFVQPCRLLFILLWSQLTEIARGGFERPHDLGVLALVWVGSVNCQLVMKQWHVLMCCHVMHGPAAHSCGTQSPAAHAHMCCTPCGRLCNRPCMLVAQVDHVQPATWVHAAVTPEVLGASSAGVLLSRAVCGLQQTL